MKKPKRPDDSELCSHPKCAHTFGEHYQTYSGDAYGCDGDAEETMSGCTCDGFKLLMTYPSK